MIFSLHQSYINTDEDTEPNKVSIGVSNNG
jgi:hypothetical protein